MVLLPSLPGACKSPAADHNRTRAGAVKRYQLVRPSETPVSASVADRVSSGARSHDWQPLRSRRPCRRVLHSQGIEQFLSKDHIPIRSAGCFCHNAAGQKMRDVDIGKGRAETGDRLDMT